MDGYNKKKETFYFDIVLFKTLDTMLEPYGPQY